MNYEAKVLGIRFLDFMDDQNRPVKGYQVWVAAVTDEASWTKGVEVIKIWVADSAKSVASVASLIPGDDIVICFNRRGKPQIVEVL